MEGTRQTPQRDRWSYLSESITGRFHEPILLGYGAFGEVYRAVDTHEDIYVAVKTIYYRKDYNNDLYWTRELEALKTAKSFNITSLYNWLQEPTVLVLVMEYAAGGCLERRQGLKPQPERLIRFYLYQTLMAVLYLHSLKIIHRDIKPDNILLIDHEIFSLAKLADFGYARPLAENNMMTAVGTPCYAAPEAFDGMYDERVDIWSTGMTMARLITGKVPDHSCAITAWELNLIFRSPKWWTAPKAEAFAHKLLTFDPAKRYTVVEALRDPWFKTDELKSDLCILAERIGMPGVFEIDTYIG